MATVFMETPDATQAKEFWSSVDGLLTYDTTLATKSGLASWKCDSGANNPAALNINVAASQLSIYFNFTDFPGSTQNIIAEGVGVFKLRITSGGVLQLFDSTNTQRGGDGSTLSTGTWYRISAIQDAANERMIIYLDGVQDIDSGTVTSEFDVEWSSEHAIGWSGTPGTDKVLNLQHVYFDNTTNSTADMGDVRVTAKLPTNSGGTNGWDGDSGSPDVAERPINNANYHTHAGSDDQVESSDIEAVGVGDVDITGETILGHTGWCWAKRGSGGSGSPSILVNDVETLITLTTTEQMFVDVITSASYPSGGTDEIGMHSTDTGANTFWYEGGVMIAYIASAVGAVGWGFLLAQSRNRLAL